MHLQFLKILSYPQLFAFFNYQPAKSQQDLTVSMTAVSSHFLWHNTNHCRIPVGFTLPLKVPLVFNIRSSPFFLMSCITVFKCARNVLHHPVATAQKWNLQWQFRFIWWSMSSLKDKVTLCVFRIYQNVDCWKIVAMESFGGSEFGNFHAVTFFWILFLLASPSFIQLALYLLARPQLILFSCYSGCILHSSRLLIFSQKLFFEALQPPKQLL